MDVNRKEFIKICSGACLSFIGISLLTQGCAPGMYIDGQLTNKTLSFPKSAFIHDKNGTQTVRTYVIVRNEQLNYPLAVYRDERDQYKALLLRCTHQGAELAVHGNLITCSAHGSEFDINGKVTQGPAAQSLISYPTQTDAEKIYIQLA